MAIDSGVFIDVYKIHAVRFSMPENAEIITRISRMARTPPWREREFLHQKIMSMFTRSLGRHALFYEGSRGYPTDCASITR
jgi:hypothetical protein